MYISELLSRVNSIALMLLMGNWSLQISINRWTWKACPTGKRNKCSNSMSINWPLFKLLCHGLKSYVIQYAGEKEFVLFPFPQCQCYKLFQYLLMFSNFLTWFISDLWRTIIQQLLLLESKWLLISVCPFTFLMCSSLSHWLCPMDGLNAKKLV